MKVAVGVALPSNNPEFEKLNETLHLLSQVSLSLRTSNVVEADITPNGIESFNGGLPENSDLNPVEFKCIESMSKITRNDNGRIAKRLPSRPGFPGSQGARGYPPQPGAQGPLYQPTNQGYLGGRPAIPPKSVPRIMTAEELANHEAQEKLRQRQFEDSKLEEKLMIQKKQAEADKLWLQQEEEQLKPERTPSNGDLEEQDPDHLYQSADEVRQRREASAGRNAVDVAPPPPSMPPAKPPRNPPIKDVQVAQPRPPTFEEVKPTPTMKLDREGDAVYRDTMLVVKAVLQANQEVMAAKPDEIFVLVKNIGKALKELCTSLDQETPHLPPEYHREIDMAQKTTNKDLSQVINQMKLVKRFYSTTQVTDYKKCMMAATQVLAMDAKNLLDVVDKSRLQALAGASNGHATSNPEEPSGESAGPDHTLPPPPSELLHDA